MSIKIDAKWFQYRDYHINRRSTMFDFIIKGILLEGFHFDYISNSTMDKDWDSPNSKIAFNELYTGLLATDTDSDIDHIVASRRVTSNRIFEKIKNHPDIKAWLNGESSLVLEFYNVYPVLYGESSNVSEITLQRYFNDITPLRLGMHYATDGDCRRLTLDPPLPPGHEYYNQGVIDVLKYFKASVNYSHLFVSNSEDVTPGYLCLSDTVCPNKSYYSDINPFSIRVSSVIPEDDENVNKYTISTFIAWALYHSDRLVILNRGLENYRRNYCQNIEDDSRDYIVSHSDCDLYYEDPYDLGYTLNDGLKMACNPYIHYPRIDLCGKDIFAPILEGLYQGILKSAISKYHTPLKEYVGVEVFSKAFKRKTFKTKKAPLNPDVNNIADILRALAFGFMSAYKIISDIDSQVKNKKPDKDMLNYMLDYIASNSDEISNELHEYKPYNPVGDGLLSVNFK